MQSGVIDSDDFNDGVLNEHRWVKMQHREIFPTEEGGYLVIRGTPSENAKGWWHAGAMTTRGVSKGLPDVVMAVKYLLPNWDYACTMDWEEFPIYEAHLCNDTPDRNHSIRISRMCPGGAVKRALFGGLSEAQLPKQQINNSGVEMFVSYNDGKAQGFIVDKDGRVHPATKETAVELEDYKRMELKSVLAPRGVEVFLKVDWAVLYPQPRDVPAQVRVEGVPATAIKVQIGDWHKMASVAKGMATVQLPADKIYPAAASITVLNGEQVIGTLAIRRSKDLWGLYPGDTWKVSKR
ncbi:MAG: hypothetical protein R3228_07880 [Halioglobus sp.]|nr:hypothetical protein [Halioglobus sp.]